MKILGRNQTPPPAKTLAQEEAEAAALVARERRLMGLDDEENTQPKKSSRLSRTIFRQSNLNTALQSSIVTGR